MERNTEKCYNERKHGRKLSQDRNEHGERDLKQSINLLMNCNNRNPMEKANLCFFVATRGSWPQFMVPKGGKEVKAMLIAFSIFFLSLFNLLWKTQMETTF